MVKIYIADISNLTDPKEHPELLNELGESRKEKGKFLCTADFF